MAGAGYKQWVDGDILTAGDVNTYLMDQAVMVFDDSAARGTAVAAPTEGMVSYLKDTNLLQYYDGSAWENVVLTPGKVLQVVSQIDNTVNSTTSTTFVDTGLSATITPSLATSKILVICHHLQYSTQASFQAGSRTQLLRGATAIVSGTSATQYDGNFASGQTSNDIITMWSISYLDSPATTSATTYKTQFRAEVAGGTVYVDYGGFPGSMTLLEIGA